MYHLVLKVVVVIISLNRFIFRSDQFDIDTFKSAAQMFVGKHDFRSFMRYSKEEKTVSHLS